MDFLFEIFKLISVTDGDRGIPVKLASEECHRTLLMINQHWLGMAWCRQATSH